MESLGLGINYTQYISSTIYSKCSVWLRPLRFANLPRLFTADCSAGVTTGALSKIQPQGGVPSLQARKQWPGEMVTDDLVWRCLERGPIDSDCKNGKLQPLRSEWKLFEHVVFVSKTSLWWSGSSTHRVFFLFESCREACHHIDHSFQFFWRDATDTPVPLVPSPYCHTVYCTHTIVSFWGFVGVVRNILGYLPAIHPMHAAIHLMPDPFPLPFNRTAQPLHQGLLQRLIPRTYVIWTVHIIKYKLFIFKIILYSTYSFHLDDVIHPFNLV